MRHLISNNCSESGSGSKPSPKPAGQDTWLKQNPAFGSMLKGASMMSAAPARTVLQALAGGVAGGASGYLFGAVDPASSPVETRSRMLQNAIYEGTIAALAAPAVARSIKKIASWWGAEPPDLEERANLYKAKAAFSRAKLRLGSTFKKMAPEDQVELLAAHDNYHQSVESAIRSGRLRE